MTELFKWLWQEERQQPKSPPRTMKQLNSAVYDILAMDNIPKEVKAEMIREITERALEIIERSKAWPDT